MHDGLLFAKSISTLYRYYQSYLKHRLEPYSLGSGQDIFLLILFEEEGINQEELSKKLNIEKGTTAKALQKLEKEGYIIKKVDNEDKRAYKVYVTNKALAIKPILQQISSQWNAMLSSDFTNEEKILVSNLFKKMEDNATFFLEDKLDPSWMVGSFILYI